MPRRSQCRARCNYSLGFARLRRRWSTGRCNEKRNSLISALGNLWNTCELQRSWSQWSDSDSKLRARRFESLDQPRRSNATFHLTYFIRFLVVTETWKMLEETRAKNIERWETTRNWQAINSAGNVVTFKQPLLRARDVGIYFVQFVLSFHCAVLICHK